MADGYSKIGSKLLHGRSWLLSFVGDALPTEFRLFKAGWNETENGNVLFDEQSAESTISAFGTHGVDVPIDLEHLSVDPEGISGDARNFDPDARGWAKLELRNGELWAVNVTWGPDGARRLHERTQRYVSPAFLTDSDGRVTKIHNIALTASPATREAMPLVASVNYREGIMSAKLMAELCTLLRSGKHPDEIMTLLAMDIKTVQAVVKAMGGDPGADLGTLFATIQEFAKALADSATGKKPAEPVAEEPVAEEPVAEEAVQTMRASRDEIELMRAELKKSNAQLALLTAERDARDAVERRGLVAELVKLGRETPASAWADDDGSKPKGILLSMPLVELRDRVKLFSASPLANQASARPAVGAAGLTPKQIEICSETGCKPEIFAALKARHVGL